MTPVPLRRSLVRQSRAVAGAAACGLALLAAAACTSGGARSAGTRGGATPDVAVLAAPRVMQYRRVVMIEQYRHGTNTVELEIPGGVMDPQETDPVAAGQRELREETGYEGTGARIIGRIFPNPAIQSNTCHTLLVRACELRHPTEFDHSEDIHVRLVPVEHIPDLIASGRIRHALVVVALTHFLMLRPEGSAAP